VPRERCLHFRVGVLKRQRGPTRVRCAFLWLLSQRYPSANTLQQILRRAQRLPNAHSEPYPHHRHNRNLAILGREREATPISRVAAWFAPSISLRPRETIKVFSLIESQAAREASATTDCVSMSMSKKSRHGKRAHSSAVEGHPITRSHLRRNMRNRLYACRRFKKKLERFVVVQRECLELVESIQHVASREHGLGLRSIRSNQSAPTAGWHGKK